MNNTVVTKEDYDELCGDLEYLGSKCNDQEKEIRYMHDFIRWMHLGDQYENFRKNAYEYEPEDGSFSYYTIDEKTPGIACS